MIYLLAALGAAHNAILAASWNAVDVDDGWTIDDYRHTLELFEPIDWLIYYLITPAEDTVLDVFRPIPD